jgi:hypothetical protein
VVVEHGGTDEERYPDTAGYIDGGSAAAAPIAANVMKQVLLRDPGSRPTAKLDALEANLRRASGSPA